MEPLTQMNCPACGSPALVQESVTTLRCENCNSVVQRSTSTSFLEVLGIGCYSCGAVNEKGIKFCTNCGTELIVDCPDCNSPILLGQKRCGKCGIDILEVYKNIIVHLETSIDENKKIISHNEEIVAENEKIEIKKSTNLTKATISVFIFSVIGALIIAVYAYIDSEASVALAGIIFLCTLIPIFAGIMLLVFISIGSEKKNINKKITTAKDEIKKFEEDNRLLKDELSMYIIYNQAYTAINA